MHVMLDLETMSTAPNAAIIQIGAVLFDLEGDSVTGEFERTVSLQSSIMAGGTIDPKTVAWWKDRPKETQERVTGNAMSLALALSEFSAWFPKGGIVWGHGANFDPPILEMACRALDIPTPWFYRDVRDVRTVFWLADTLAGWKRPERETAHTALFDARDQAFDVQAAYKALANAALNKTLYNISLPAQPSAGTEADAEHARAA